MAYNTPRGAQSAQDSGFAANHGVALLVLVALGILALLRFNFGVALP
jgi:hypothetical protein